MGAFGYRSFLTSFRNLKTEFLNSQGPLKPNLNILGYQIKSIKSFQNLNPYLVAVKNLKAVET